VGEPYHVAGLPDPTLDHEAINLRTLNRKILKEIRANNQLQSLKHLRLDGQNQIVSDLQMNGQKTVRLVDATAPADGVNKRTLDAAVNSLRSENEQLILATNENISQRVMFLDGTSMPENHHNYNGKRITNLGGPAEDTDTATKGFVGNQLRKRTFHANPEGAQEHLKMNNHKISGLANPTQNNAVQKLYVDERVDNLHQQLENLQARVVRLERLGLQEAAETDDTTEPAG